MLRRILPLFLLPVGVCLELTVVGLVTARKRFVVAGLVVLWVGSTPLFSGALVSALEPDAGRLVAAEMAVADAVVVLGLAPGTERFSEWPDADRFFGGLALMEAGRAPLLVFTGAASRTWPDAEVEGEVLRRYAIDFGVADSSILVSSRVWTTEDEALAVSRLLLERTPAARRVLLVTSAFHMSRAVGLFERTELEVIPFPVDFRGGYDPFELLDLFPSAGALRDTEMALRELYGRAFYLVF
jgi:uncharacterized SAM-binding protein YcdF (DUF218 family)